jgi:DNA mismatch repair protein MutS2
VEVGGKRMRMPVEALEPLESAGTPGPPPARAAGARVSGPSVSSGTGEVNVIGRRLDEAIDEVERALDAAILAGDSHLRVVHGHGTGKLRDGLRAHLRGHRAVASIRAADPREGGNGATLVELK